jgi:hypothetical protein
MSCAAFTVLGVYVAAANRGNSWVVGGSAVLAAVFFVVAAYKTWRDEHNKYVDEIAKSLRPDIRGEAFNFSGYGIHGDGHTRGHWSASCDVTFELYFCNHRPINTTLKSLELDGSRLTPTVTFGFDLIDGLRPEKAFPVGMEVPHGIGKTITVVVTATVDGMRIPDIPPIVMDNLEVHVIDAFELKHPIRIRPGERLRFGER